MTIKDKIIEQNKKGIYCLPTWQEALKLSKKDHEEIIKTIQENKDKINVLHNS